MWLQKCESLIVNRPIYYQIPFCHVIIVHIIYWISGVFTPDLDFTSSGSTLMVLTTSRASIWVAAIRQQSSNLALPRGAGTPSISEQNSTRVHPLPVGDIA